MRLLQWLVYITNLYIIFGIFVLIWLLYGEYIASMEPLHSLAKRSLAKSLVSNKRQV